MVFIFAISVFLSAFLLFQIQPMIGKIILPWFGGTPAVWSTVMLFFQVLLTGGYAYAYWLIRHVKNQFQSLLHSTLSISALLVLAFLANVWKSPITPPPDFHSNTAAFPVLEIFKILVVSVGLPYFVLAANGPLIQTWFSQLFPQRSYARLYALSNVGSLLGLLAYPVFIEPNLSLKGQGWAWSVGFAVFVLLNVWIAFRNRRTTISSNAVTTEILPSSYPAPALLALWIALSATASLLLLSVTNQISQEVAVIPFLWILPLTIYLLTFILAFSGERGYSRKLYLILFAAAFVLFLFALFTIQAQSLYIQIFAYVFLMFSGCMLCHGELYRLRPTAEHLTSFYIMVSIGGALGGVYVGLIAPLIFKGYWEFMVALTLTLALWLTIIRVKDSVNHVALVRFMLTVFGLSTIALSLIGNTSGILFVDRNFYGVIRIRELRPLDSKELAYVMIHGATVHGLQFIAPQLRDLPTTYYVPEGGGGLVLLNYPRAGRALKVGILGLGIGTLAAYGQAGDEYRLYEINPIVINLANGQGGYFSYLRDSHAHITTVLGDARISLERELAARQPQDFNVLVLDTFSSDSIPVHLVTKEAFAVYLQHLAPDGIIAAHISNQHLDLRPVFWRLAQYYGLYIVGVDYAGDNQGGYPTDWLLMTRDKALLEIPAIKAHSTDLSNYSTNLSLWTDDYSNLFQILR